MVDCYADANFVGLWGHENTQGSICAGSRTGFLVNFSNCPLLWVSKTQTDIALSTLHSEYVSLSHSFRALLTLNIIIKEVIYNLGIDSEKMKFVSSSTIYKYNNRAIVVTTSPSISPIPKHISVKYHWFGQQIERGFVIRKVESENQKADIFTKGLQGQIFVRIMKLLCGWQAFRQEVV